MKTVLKVGALATLLAALVPAPHAAEPPAAIDGTYRWNFTMPDGTAARVKLQLTTEDGKLTGTTSFRPGSEAPIRNAALQGDELRFQVVRQRDGRDIVTTYAGKWNGTGIRGTIETDWDGGKRTFDWVAQRANVGVDGTWRWTTSFGGFGGRSGATNNASGTGGGNRSRGGGGGGGGRGFESRVELQQQGETLTGSTTGRSGRRTEIKNGTFKNGEVYFEIERSFGGATTLTKYRGKLAGDTIKGTSETNFDGEDRKSDWEATRVD